MTPVKCNKCGQATEKPDLKTASEWVVEHQCSGSIPLGSCPECGCRGFNSGNGCDSCGFRPPQSLIDAGHERLRQEVRQIVNSSARAIEWGGVDGPQDAPRNAETTSGAVLCPDCGLTTFPASGYSRHECPASPTARCVSCGEQTTGSVGAAGIKWKCVCQPCKDREDADLLALAVRIGGAK